MEQELEIIRTLGKSANMPSDKLLDVAEIYSELLDEFLIIAKKYNYDEQLTDDILITPITLGEIVDADRRGCKPDVSWAKTALMYSK